MELIKYGTTLEMVRPKKKGRTILNVDFFGTSSGIPEEIDISAICSKGNFLYLAGERNKMIYKVTPLPDSAKIQFDAAFDYPNFPGGDIKVDSVIGMATAHNGNQEYIYIVGINDDNILVLFRMTDSLEVDEYFVIDDGQQSWPKWNADKKYGRGIFSDGIFLYMSGGEYAEKIIKLSQTGDVIAEFHKGTPEYVTISLHGTTTSGWYVDSKYCYIYNSKNVGLWYYVGPFGTVSKSTKSEILILAVEDINQNNVYNLIDENDQKNLTDANIELVLSSSSSTQDTYKQFNYKRQLSPFPFSSGLTSIHSKPYVVNRSTEQVGIDGKPKQALIRMKDKSFESESNGIIRGLEPFSIDFNKPDFEGDIHYDGQFFWASQAGIIYKLEMVYHCFIVDGHACENIDIGKISAGEIIDMPIELKNVSSGNMTDVILKIDQNNPSAQYVKFYENLTEKTELNITEILAGQTANFAIKANLPADYESNSEEKFVGLISIEYKIKY